MQDSGEQILIAGLSLAALQHEAADTEADCRV